MSKQKRKKRPIFVRYVIICLEMTRFLYIRGYTVSSFHPR